MNLPSFENFTMRAFESSPMWPSATKMSPFGAMTTAEGWLKVSVPLPATPALPRRISTLPSGLNLNTWWPLPSFALTSVTQTLPSRVDVQAVRLHEQAAAEAAQELARGD